MRILYLHPALRSYRFKVFSRLAENGVHFLFTSKNDPETPAGKETSSLLKNFPGYWAQAREFTLGGFKNLSVSIVLAFKYDVVIFSGLTSVPFLFLSLPLKILGKKIILFDEMWLFPRRPRIYLVIRYFSFFLCKRCVDAFILAGTNSKLFFQNEVGITSDRIFIAPNYCDSLATETKESIVDPSKVESGTQSSESTFFKTEIFEQWTRAPEFKILYLGRIVQYKGLDLLLQAVHKISKVKLMVVGDGPFLSECQEIARNLNLGPKAIFYGACNSEFSPIFFRAADLFILPARFMLNEKVNCESWGLVVNESLAEGTPVIATTAVGAATDLLVDGECGITIKSDSQDQLTRAIQEWQTKKMHRQEIKEKVTQKANWKLSLQGHVAALRFVMGEQQSLIFNEDRLD